MGAKLSKKVILIIVLVGVLIVVAVLIYLWPIIKPVKEKPAEKITSEEEITPEEKTIINQLEELQASPTALTEKELTEEEIRERLTELEKQPSQTISEEEIIKQLEELNKID